MPLDNHFQYAKNDLNGEIMLLNAAMNDFSYGIHAHEEFSFGVTLSGRQDFFALGEHHKSHPTNTIIFNPDDAHDGCSGGDETLHYKMLYIHPDQLIPMLKSAGLSKADHFRVNQCVHRDPVLQQHILHLASLVEDNCTSAMHYSSALFEFARYLTLQTGTQVEKKYTKKDATFERVRDYLHSHITHDLSLDELSQIAHMSKYHFLRRFRDYFGMTPHKYWQSYRLSKARQAIESGISIADVVYIFGFNDVSYFNRCFKPVFGMTPYQFRRGLQFT
ncbi:AraC family transcriptional regulator [Marinomonas sp.]|nr:AraC family transcriptional regulator [Marinomonas sp.]MDB4837200.1 AraC family transcriptional regulator [Marinomonas sp.]